MRVLPPFLAEACGPHGGKSVPSPGPGRGRAGVAAFLLLPSLLAGPAAHGAGQGDDQLIQELFLGETPYPQRRDETQLTLGAVHLRTRPERLTTLSFGAEYGFTDRFQVEIEIPHLLRRSGAAAEGEEGNRSDASGFGDVSLGVLYAVVNERSRVLSVSLEAGLPSGSRRKGLGEGRILVEPQIRAGLEIGGTWLFGALGAEFAGSERSFTYSAAVARPLPANFVGVLELSGFAGDERVAYLVPGLVWRAPFEAEFQLGVPIGLTREAADWGAVAKVVVEF